MKVGRLAVVTVLIVVIAVVATRTSAKSQQVQQPPVKSTDLVSGESGVPLRVVIGIDETLSMAGARVPQISGASLAPILERIEKTGGEVAIGFIREKSDAPLLRLYVASPPDVAAPKTVGGDIFTRAKQKRELEKRAAELAAERRDWRSDASARVNAFLGELNEQLKRPADAKHTEIRTMIERADLFLSEPTTYPIAPKNVIIFVTDGADDMNADPPPSLSSHAVLLLVNGVGTVAYLAPLNPLRFESLDAALRFTVAEVNHVR